MGDRFVYSLFVLHEPVKIGEHHFKDGDMVIWKHISYFSEEGAENRYLFSSSIPILEWETASQERFDWLEQNFKMERKFILEKIRKLNHE